MFKKEWVQVTWGEVYPKLGESPMTHGGTLGANGVTGRGMDFRGCADAEAAIRSPERERKCSYTGLRGSSPGVLLLVAGDWLPPLPGPLESLRKTELKEACVAEKEEGAHEEPGLAPPTMTSGSPARCEV